MATAAKARPSAEDRIRAALWFAERDFGVFTVWSTTADGLCRCPKGAACDNPGKHPVTANGFHDATTDPDRIRTLLSAGSDPNYGLVCPDGVFALDVDGEGVSRLAELEATHGMLPPTLRTTTAHGEHVFLRWPEALPRPIGHLFGFVTRWGSGSNAGYVIGPRSVHASGAVYAPAGGSLDVAELPDSWARAAVEGRRTSTTLVTITGGGYELPERVPAAESRYEAIRAYTAHLYNRGLGATEMWPLVRDLLAPRFEQPLSEPELRSRFERTTANLGPRLGDRRLLPDAPPEPIDPSTFPLPEDRGQATLSDLGTTEYVEDLVRPGRIIVWAAEEGSGKSFAVAGELAIRMAVAGGDFAGTWRVVQTGPVLVLSEMHSDDDYDREEMVLAALNLTRRDLSGHYYRLGLMTAAGGRPALTVPEWRDWVTAWLRDRGALLLVVDTATGATQVDPWGREIQTVYASLRLMLEQHPGLAVILVVHTRKPREQGARRLSDVMGEWGRWCDVVVLQENDGQSLERAKLSVRKRVRRERRVVVTKAGGLLVDPLDLDGLGESKVPAADILAAIGANPGIGYKELGDLLGVSKATASRYVRDLGDRLEAAPTGPKRAIQVFLGSPAEEEPPQTASQGRDAVNVHENAPHHTTSRSGVAQSDSDRITASHHLTEPVMQSESGVLTASSDTTPIGVGGGVVSDDAVGQDRSASQARDAVEPDEAESRPVLTAPPDSAPVESWCQAFVDHQSRHRDVSTDSPWCEICSPRPEAG